jgi:hypothetical protein
MKKIFTVSFFSLIIAITSFAQVSVNTDGTPANASAGLEVKYTDKGFLPLG